MVNNEKISAFIAKRRKELGMTQNEVAGRLNVSFQSVSKWENGTLPNVEILMGLAELLQVSADEILSGRQKSDARFSYSGAGVDIAYTDRMKRTMEPYLKSSDPRVLNGLGPFASLYDIEFPDIPHPVLVLKSEEPGSKQKLAMEYGYAESVCHDMINHLVNDIAVMGAKPLAVLDTIVCGNAECETVRSFIKGISEACRENECSLVGGETSIQPQVVEHGVYILTSGIAGIVPRDAILDGSSICEGDVVLAAASNGLHTNGYSLVRMLMERMPQIKLEKFDNGNTFIEEIMKVHTPYYKAVKGLFGRRGMHGMAHITGGGIAGNLCRIIPTGLTAQVDLARLEILPVFGYIKQVGDIEEDEMLSTFNCGAGMILVTSPDAADEVKREVSRYYHCYEIGTVCRGEKKVAFKNRVNWKI